MQKRLGPLLPTKVLRERFEAVESVQNLGIIFDCGFSFENHVDDVFMSRFIGPGDLWRIRQ